MRSKQKVRKYIGNGKATKCSQLAMLNFSNNPLGSSQEAVNAVVQRGVGTMFDIQVADGVADVAFMFEEEVEEGKEEGGAWEAQQQPPHPTLSQQQQQRAHRQSSAN